jgi:signal peptidase II
MSLRRLCFVISILILVSDQASKILIQQILAEGQSSPLIPFVNLYLAHNQGAAFSFLASAGGWQRWFLAALAFVISIIISIWIYRLPAHEKLTGVSLALILGGALGNLVDRVFYGYVIDFIDFHYSTDGNCLILFNKWFDQNCHYATFNIADSAISVGVTVLVLSSLYTMYRDFRK